MVFPVNIQPYTIFEWWHKHKYFKLPSLWLLFELLRKMPDRILPYICLAWYGDRSISYSPEEKTITPFGCTECTPQLLSFFEDFISNYNPGLRKKIIQKLEQASTIILVSCKKKYSQVFDDNVNWDLHAKDIEVTDLLSIGAAIQNMLLKATDLGYGTLWLCDIFYAYPQLENFLQTKDAIVSAVCIGKTNEDPKKCIRLPVNAVSAVLKKEKE